MNYGTLELIRDLWQYIRPYKGKFFAGTLLRLSSDVIWLYPPWAISQIINFAIDYTPGASLHTFWFYTITIWIAGLYHYCTHDAAKYLIYQVSEAMRLDAIKQAIQHIFRLDPDWHEKENSGNKLQKIHKAGESLDTLMRMYVDLCIESTTNVIGVTIVLFSLGTWMSGFMFLFFLTYYLFSRKLTRKSSSSSLEANKQWEDFEGIMFESVNNIVTIRALGFWNPVINWLKRKSVQLYAAIKNRIFWYRTRSVLLNLWRELFRQIILFYVIMNVFAGQLDVGVISLIMLYFLKIADSAGELSEVAYNFELSRIAMMRFKAILKSEPTAELSGHKVFPEKWKELTVQDLEFGYGESKVLKKLSLSIRRGEKVGIVGLSGAGKSTLFKLLLKLYDRYEGSITFNGEELKDIKRDSYLKHFSYVPQETELFNLSLKDNVTMAFEKPINKELFQRALDVAHVNDFLHKLPHGVESLIGEKGVKLSGGERQRVGIARAIYRNPELLFMDEATSHLDVESETKIRQALHEFFKSVTAIVIAHRLSTLKEMDRVLVLEKGRIIEEGTFEELIKKKGRFHALWEKQAL